MTAKPANLSATRPLAASLGRAAYEMIKRDILQCNIEPGAEITETQLARKYRLGKAPVRAALARLGQEGFIRPIPRRGHVVNPITVQDIHDLFEYRLLIEPATASLAASRIDRETLEELRRLNEADLKTGLAFNSANTEFHRAIARAAGNRWLIEAVSQLHDQIERVMSLMIGPLGPLDLREHQRIIDALAAGDGSSAQKAVTDHIESGRANVLAAVHRNRGVMEAHVVRS